MHVLWLAPPFSSISVVQLQARTSLVQTSTYLLVHSPSPQISFNFLIWSCVNLFASMPVFDNIPSNDVICAVTFSAATWAVVFFLVPDVDGHSLVVS